MRRLAAFWVESRAEASVLVCWAAAESALRAMAESATCAAWLAALRAAFFCCLAACMLAPIVAAEPTAEATSAPIASVSAPMMLKYELRVTKYELE